MKHESLPGYLVLTRVTPSQGRTHACDDTGNLRPAFRLAEVAKFLSMVRAA
jgi:hypothetical protein